MVLSGFICNGDDLLLTSQPTWPDSSLIWLTGCDQSNIFTFNGLFTPEKRVFICFGER